MPDWAFSVVAASVTVGIVALAIGAMWLTGGGERKKWRSFVAKWGLTVTNETPDALGYIAGTEVQVFRSYNASDGTFSLFEVEIPRAAESAYCVAVRSRGIGPIPGDWCSSLPQVLVGDADFDHVFTVYATPSDAAGVVLDAPLRIALVNTRVRTFDYRYGALRFQSFHHPDGIMALARYLCERGWSSWN